MLAKLNTLEDQLDAMTAKYAPTASTAKLDALTTETHDVWRTTHFTKGWRPGRHPDDLRLICGHVWVAHEARSAARYAAYGNPDVQTILHPCP